MTKKNYEITINELFQIVFSALLQQRDFPSSGDGDDVSATTKSANDEDAKVHHLRQ